MTVVGDDAQNQQCTLKFETGGAEGPSGVGGSPGTCSYAIGDDIGEVEEEAGVRKGDPASSRWMFSMEMNVQVLRLFR